MTPDDIRDAYSMLAPRWDTAGAEWNVPVARRLVELAGLEPPMHVLDVGCGAGAAAIAAARAVRPGGMVTGIDNAAPMLDRACERAVAEGLTIAFQVADATEPPFLPASFDAVTASLVAYLLPDPGAALQHWREMVEPLGVVAYTWVLSEDSRLLPVYRIVDEFLEDGRQGWVEFTSRAPWDSVASAEGLASGFGEVSTVIEPVATRFDSPVHWWESSRSQGPWAFWRHIAEWERAAARHAAMRALKPLCEKDGSLIRVRQVCYTIARLT